jgi:hypothetical protein
MLDRQPLVDPTLSSAARGATGRARFADGGAGRKPYGW